MGITFKNRGEKSAEIWLYGVVGDDWDGMTDKQFIAELNKLGQVDRINLRINSEGGSVLDGYAIYNALVRHPATIAVDVDAFAGSIASIIAMAGDSISMAANSWMMIHDPTGLAWGSATDMRKMADILDGIRGTLVSTYEARTKNRAADISHWMTDETWFSADEAVQHGFADVVTQELKIAAMANVKKFRRAPPAFQAQASAAHQAGQELLAVRLQDFERRVQKAQAVRP